MVSGLPRRTKLWLNLCQNVVKFFQNCNEDKKYKLKDKLFRKSDTIVAEMNRYTRKYFGTRGGSPTGFWAAGRRPYIVFTFTGSVRNIWNDVNIYIYGSRHMKRDLSEF